MLLALSGSSISEIFTTSIYIWGLVKWQAGVYFCEDVNSEQQMAGCVYKPEAAITTANNSNTKELSREQGELEC